MAQWNFEDGDHFQVVTTLPGPQKGAGGGGMRIGSFFDIFIEYRAMDPSGNPTRGTATVQIPIPPSPVQAFRFRVVDITTQNTPPAGSSKEAQLTFQVMVDGNDGGSQSVRLNGLPPGEPVIGTLTVYSETTTPDANKGDSVPVSKMFVTGKDGTRKAHSEGFFDITY